MKITNELNNKITNCINKKYESEIEEIKKEIVTEKNKRVEYYVNMVNDALKYFPDMENILKYTVGYSYGTVESIVRNTYNNRMSQEDEIIVELLAKERKILDKKKSEIENIKIKISYGKTFDDINTVFEEYGFNF